MISGHPGEQKTARFVNIAATKYRFVLADDGTTVIAGPITTGITVTGTNRGKATVTLPSPDNDYEIQWDDGSGTWAAVEDVQVTLGSTDVDPTLVDLSRKYPASTVVGAYPVTAGPINGQGPPVGLPTTTGTVSSGGIVSFTGLKTGIDYFIGAQVSGTWTWVRYHA